MTTVIFNNIKEELATSIDKLNTTGGMLVAEQFRKIDALVSEKRNVFNAILRDGNNVDRYEYPHLEEKALSVMEIIATYTYITNSPFMFYGYDINTPIKGVCTRGFDDINDVNEYNLEMIFNDIQPERELKLFQVSDVTGRVVEHNLGHFTKDKTQFIPSLVAVNGCKDPNLTIEDFKVN